MDADRLDFLLEFFTLPVRRLSLDVPSAFEAYLPGISMGPPVFNRDRTAFVSVLYLRGLAAVAVTIFHVMTYIDAAAAYWASGVDIFFIISGFVMMCSLERQPTARQFLRARALRILPLYWCALAMATVLIGPSVSEVLWNVALVPGGDGAQRSGLLVPQAWTLVCEAFFYLVLIVAIAFRRLWLAPLVLLALGCAGLFEAGALANSIQLEFLFGMALHRWRRLARWWMFPAGLALLYLLPPIPEYRGLLWGGPALLVVAGAVGAEPLLRVWRGPMLIGDASYAIYLFHIFALDATAGWLSVPLHLLAGVSVGVAVHLVLERPMMAAIRGYLRRRTAAVEGPVPAQLAVRGGVASALQSGVSRPDRPA